MRISDWSSDVCSSDLAAHQPFGQRRDAPGALLRQMHVEGAAIAAGRLILDRRLAAVGRPCLHRIEPHRMMLEIEEVVRDRGIDGHPHIVARRSEEHTSDLQSLMRISYAVSCLKKK